MAIKTSEDAWRAAQGGLAAGTLAGAVFSLLVFTTSLLAGRDPWVALELPAQPVLGAAVLARGVEPMFVIIGQVVHFAISIGWAIVFANVVYGASRAATIAFAPAWGVLVWLVMRAAVLPLFDVGVLAAWGSWPFVFFVHLVFGVIVGIGFLPYQRPRATVIATPTPPPRRAGSA